MVYFILLIVHLVFKFKLFISRKWRDCRNFRRRRDIISSTNVIYSSSDVLLFDIDSDGDNVVDSLDAFPQDSSQTSDRDGDGYGDSQSGNQSDSFPDDSTQWEDGDQDGFGDNAQGNNPDLFLPIEINTKIPMEMVMVMQFTVKMVIVFQTIHLNGLIRMVMASETI